MSRPYQYTYYNKSLNSAQSSNSALSLPPTSQQSQQTIQSLKSQLKHKQSLISQLSSRLQQQQRLLEQKEFVIKQKQLQLQYIHKQNEQLHDKIFQLNQRLNAERADIKQTIKQEVGMLKEEFNFMIKENQNKTEIIIEQQQKDFQRKEQDLKAMIKELSERGSHNGSFYYDDPHSNKPKHSATYFPHHHDDFYQNQQEKPSTANSLLKNSRESYKSNLPENNKVLTSLRQSIVGQNHREKTLKDKQPGTASVSNLINLKQGATSQHQSQVTGRFGFVKTPITSKFSVRKTPDDNFSVRRTPDDNFSVRRTPDDNKQTSSRASSRANIDEIISRSKRQLNQRSKKSSMTELPRQYLPLGNSTSSRIVRKRFEDLDNSRSSVKNGIDHLDEKRKAEKLKQISGLKMKVNMLKTQLKEEISFCQHKE